MSALREWAASCSPEAHQAVAVSSWGKWKTATQARRQLLAFAFLFCCAAHQLGMAVPVTQSCCRESLETIQLMHAVPAA